MVGLAIIYQFQTIVCTWSLNSRRAVSQQITGQGVLTDYVIVPSIFLLINYVRRYSLSRSFWLFQNTSY